MNKKSDNSLRKKQKRRAFWQVSGRRHAKKRSKTMSTRWKRARLMPAVEEWGVDACWVG